MQSSTKFAVAGVAVLLLLFFAGLIRLLRLRFDSGSVYQPYSTFRPDALGAKALHDSLAILPSLEVSRNIEDLEALPASSMTLLFLGARPPMPTHPDALQRASEGARIVVAFVPVWPESKMENVGPLYKWHALGVQLGRAVQPGFVPGEVPPRESALYFESFSPEWTVRRRLRERAVAIERPWMKGSIVLIADSYPLSNEALISRPAAGEITWLLGANRRIVFDETHLGVRESGSVAGLMRRYGFHGPMAAVVVLAMLFVWSRALSFLPEAAAARTREITGRGSSEGLLALLERSVPPARLLKICAEHWAHSPAGRTTVGKDEIEKAGASWPGAPVEGYEAIRRRLEESSHRWKRLSNN